MDDPTKEELFPEVIEAKPVQEQRFLYQCKVCASLKFEILFISDGVKKSMILVCQKGHQIQMDNIPTEVK